MLAAWYKKQMVKQAREEGFALGRLEGRAEARGAWLYYSKLLEHWKQRRAAAESEGIRFSEPRPPAPDEI